jgi:hypothetical protein
MADPFRLATVWSGYRCKPAADAVGKSLDGPGGVDPEPSTQIRA